MKWFVYILECADKTFYTGITNDLLKRVKAHNSSKRGAHYTKIRRPVELKYFKVFKTRGEALKREFAIKKLSREEKMVLCKKKVLKNKKVVKG